MIRILIFPLALACAGCPQLDVLEGKPSAFQLEQERKMAGLQSELTSVRAELAKVATVQAAPVPQPVALMAPPVPEPVKPPCQPVFRVSYCNDEGNEVMF